MAAGDLITEDYQVEYNGVVTGDTYDIEVVRCSLFSAPEVRQKVLNRPLDHGAFASDAYYAGRRVELDLEVWGATEAELQTNLVKAMQMTQLTADDEPWVMQVPGFGKVRLEGRCVRREVTPINNEYAVGHKAQITADFWFPDPRIQSNTLSSLTVDKSVASGGMSYDINYDIAYGASGSGSNQIENAGTFEVRPVVTIQGPINNPVLESITADKALEFNIELNASQTLVVDFYNRQVLLNGTSSRYYTITDVTQWWSLQPGTNDVRLNGTTVGSPSATFTWRSSWV